MKNSPIPELLSLFSGIVALIAGYHFLESEKYITASLSIILGALLLFYFWATLNRKREETEKIITAIRKKDFSLFPTESPSNPLKTEAVKLYYQTQAEHTQLTAFKQLYENLLNKQEIGFLILQKPQASSQWKVFFCNQALLNILQIPKYNRWDYYKEKAPAFFDLIEQIRYRDSQEFIHISIGESSKQSYSIRVSRLETPEQTFCTISLESVQKIIDRKEKMAWNNLMKVISHELLNTLTPVNSLLENLKYLASQDDFGKEDQEEMRDSLNIINSKSQQLLHFIDSYRQVAELPKPKKTLFNLKKTIENVLQIFENEFKRQNIRCTTLLEEIKLHADEKMIERVLVNLLTNAMHALEQPQTDKHILIETKKQNHRIILKIEDSGEGISEQIRDKIFLPFFTTRPHGSGIGLTLTKSIVEAHNGYILYRNTGRGSLFEVWFA